MANTLDIIPRGQGHEFLNQLARAGVTGDALQRVLDDAARRSALFGFFTTDVSGSMGSMETAFKFTCWNCKKEIAEDFINADIGHRIIKKCSECGKDNVMSLIFADLLFKKCLAGKPRNGIDGSVNKSSAFWSTYELGRLFDFQIEALSHDVSEQVVDLLQRQKDDVIQKTGNLSIVRPIGSIGDSPRTGLGKLVPLLPVIPFTYLSSYSQMAMVRSDGGVGYVNLDPNSIYDMMETSIEPYYIYDVEDGSEYFSGSFKESEKNLMLEERSYLTAAEVTALAFHTDVLSRRRNYTVYAIGSRYESHNLVPSISQGCRPLLAYLDISTLIKNWRLASRPDSWVISSCKRK